MELEDFGSPQYQVKPFKSNMFNGGSTDMDWDFMSQLKNAQAPEANGAASLFDLSSFTGKTMPKIAGEANWMDQFTGWTGKDGVKHSGYGSSLLGLADSGMKTWLGMKQLDLAEDAFNFQKDAFSKQFGAQQKTVNNDLAWQHKAREDRSPGSGGQMVQI